MSAEGDDTTLCVSEGMATQNYFTTLRIMNFEDVLTCSLGYREEINA